MHSDSDVEGGPDRFPRTRHSLVEAARSPSVEVRRRALESFAAAYWKPVHAYLRLKWRMRDDEAKDLTQGFFTRALEKELFERYDPSRARLRTYLRVALDAFAANEHKASQRLKRGGGAEILPLEIETPGGELVPREIPDPRDADRIFRQEWVRSLFERAVSDLQEHCAATGRSALFAIFERYDLEDPRGAERIFYADLAKEFSLPVTTVTNHLAWTRREFRRRVLELLRESTGSDEEFRAEAREILGVDPL